MKDVSGSISKHSTRFTSKVSSAQKSFQQELRAKYDCGWAQALYRVVTEKHYWNKMALFYRGSVYTYRQMFEEAHKFAYSMKALGLGKGSVVPFCTGHCPEEIFALLGASLIGAIVNPIGEHFDAQYITDRLKCKKSTIIFVTDDKFRYIEKSFRGTDIETIVMFSIKDSYPEENCFYELEKSFYDGVDRVSEYKEENKSIVSKDEFLRLGAEYYSKNGFSEEKGSIDDVFSITFSSGTTNSHRPKPIVHKVGTYSGMGFIRSKETPDLNKFSKNGEIKALVHIPLYSNTSLLASISDELFLGATLCLEHIYDERFFLSSLLINRPNLVIATPSHWISGMKEVISNPQFSNLNFKQLMAAFTAGEPTSPGEEIFINKVFKRLHAAEDFPIFKHINALGMGGGDCENCGLWRMPHRATIEKLKKLNCFGTKMYRKDTKHIALWTGQYWIVMVLFVVQIKEDY